jgi:hypothetical protein
VQAATLWTKWSADQPWNVIASYIALLLHIWEDMGTGTHKIRARQTHNGFRQSSHTNPGSRRALGAARHVPPQHRAEASTWSFADSPTWRQDAHVAARGQLL